MLYSYCKSSCSFIVLIFIELSKRIKIFDNVSVENEVIKQQKKVRFEVKEKGEKNAVTNYLQK